MSVRRALLFGIGAGVALAVAVLTPASAASVPGVVGQSSSPATPVSGEPWSPPAFPVSCHRVDDQITCTPESAADIKPQQCFVNVYIDGSKATVCTTDEAHVSALKTSGGKPLLVQYGCSVADVVCMTFENSGRGMALAATSTMFGIAQNMRFDTSSVLWTAAIGEWSFWQWAVLAVLFGAMVWAIGAAVVSGDRSELVGALVRGFLAFPASAISLWAIGHLLNAMDDLTWYVMGREGKFGLFATLQSVMWAGGQANYFFAFVIHGLLMIGMLLLMLVFAFRNIVLAALIAVGPIAWMLYPVRSVGPQWVVRYVSAVVVLLLTGPLTIGFVTLIINGLAGVRTIWDPQSWPLLIGLVLVAFAPFALFGLFSFVGAVATDSLGSRIGSGAGRVASNVARSASRIPSRIASRPAGAPSRSVGPSARQGQASSGPATTTATAMSRAPSGFTAPSATSSATSSTSMGGGAAPTSTARHSGPMPATPPPPAAAPRARVERTRS